MGFKRDLATTVLGFKHLLWCCKREQGFTFFQKQERGVWVPVGSRQEWSSTSGILLITDYIGQNIITFMSVETVRYGSSKNLSSLSLSADLGRKYTDVCNFKEEGMKLIHTIKRKQLVWLLCNILETGDMLLLLPELNGSWKWICES